LIRTVTSLSPSGTLLARSMVAATMLRNCDGFDGPMKVRVVLIDSRAERSERMQQALADSGFTVLAVIRESADLYTAIRDLTPDAIIIDADSPTRDTLEHLATLSQRFPKPMIMMSESGDAELTRAAANAGISAYVVDGLSSGVVRSLVDVAILHFHNHHLLHAELSKTQQTLEDRRYIDRAKCMLMERHGFSENRAYGLMRHMAMRRSQRLGDFSRALLAAEGLET
jgi:response regulator NasT